MHSQALGQASFSLRHQCSVPAQHSPRAGGGGGAFCPEWPCGTVGSLRRSGLAWWERPAGGWCPLVGFGFGWGWVGASVMDLGFSRVGRGHWLVGFTLRKMKSSVARICLLLLIFRARVPAQIDHLGFRRAVLTADRPAVSVEGVPCLSPPLPRLGWGRASVCCFRGLAAHLSLSLPPSVPQTRGGIDSLEPWGLLEDLTLTQVLEFQGEAQRAFIPSCFRICSGSEYVPTVRVCACVREQRLHFHTACMCLLPEFCFLPKI